MAIGDKLVNLDDLKVVYDKVDGEVSDLKGHLEEIGVRHINLFNKSTAITGKYLSDPGILADNSNFFASDYINVAGLNTITLSYTHIAYWYTADHTPISAVSDMNSISADKTVTVPTNAAYIRFSSFNANLDTAQVGTKISRYDYVPYDYYRLPYFVPENTGIEQKFDLLNFESNGNLYNVQNIIYEKYISLTSGQIINAPNTAFAYSPTYIQVNEGESLCSSGRPFVAYYDNNLFFLSGMQMDTSKTTVVPSGAKYARFSIAADDHTAVVIAKGTSAPSIGEYSFTLKGLRIEEESDIIVDASGAGDYTSFTEAVYDNVDNGKRIIVKPGTYDIKAEYIAKFGQTVVDNLADSTIGIKRFQFGIRIHDRTVVFEPGAHLVCDWTGQTVDGTHRFSPLAIASNATLIGLDLDCTAVFYGIHDDYGDNVPYTNAYKMCRVVGHDLANNNCIGGGCGKYSKHILQNCYFKNNVSSDNEVLSADVRYHNTNINGAEPEIYVSDCYFSNNFNACWYGDQTTKMRVYVNNCYASKGIIKRAETATATVDNVELFAWNNQTAN